MASFSERRGFAKPDAPITIREDAPADFRNAAWGLAQQYGLGEMEVADLVLEAVPYPGFRNDVPVITMGRNALFSCDWFKVYDWIEAVARRLREVNPLSASRFETAMNEYFRTHGFAWHISEGEVEVRGTAALDASFQRAVETLDATGHATASKELHEAWRDLSRRPNPDTTGAIQHATAALECVARDISGEKSTLGKILNDHHDLFPVPLGKAVEQLWGFASNQGRHLSEGGEPDFNVALLVAGIASAIAAFVAAREQDGSKSVSASSV